MDGVYKGKSVFVILILVLIFAVVGMILSSYSTAQEVKQPRVQGATLEGQIIGVIQFERDINLDKVLTPDKLSKSGWIRTATHYQRVVVLSDFSVALNDISDRQSLTSKGTFSLVATPGTHKLNIIDADGELVAEREVHIEGDMVAAGNSLYLPVVIVNDLKNHSCCTVTKKQPANNPGHEITRKRPSLFRLQWTIW